MLPEMPQLRAVRRHKARHSKHHVYKLPSRWRWRCNIISTVLCNELITSQVLASRTIGLKAEKLLMASSLLCLSMDCHVTVSALTWRVICEFHRTGQHSFSCQWMVPSCFVSSLCNSSPWWTLAVCNFQSFEVFIALFTNSTFCFLQFVVFVTCPVLAGHGQRPGVFADGTATDASRYRYLHFGGSKDVLYDGNWS
jgi:hypothetical protein